MNQPEQPVQPVPPQPAIVVIYLTDSDSEDEPEEPEAPAPVARSLSALEELEFPPPNREDFWNNFPFESQLFHRSGTSQSPLQGFLDLNQISLVNLPSQTTTSRPLVVVIPIG
jgi:hypothetical protein